MSIRPVKRITQSTPTIEGAGVHCAAPSVLAITSDFDPFLLMDDFRNDIPSDYLAGFPWHPHRGIETITYVLAGTVEHGDSLGNRGAHRRRRRAVDDRRQRHLHQEMPKGDAEGRMHGFQLWANLPSSLKMTAPRYQDIPARQFLKSSTTTARWCAWSAAISGANAGRSTASPPSRAISTSPCRRTSARPCRWRPIARPSPISSRAPATFCSASEPFGVLTRRQVDGEEPLVREPGRQPLAGGVRQRRRGERAGRRAGHPLPAGLRQPIKEPVAWHGPIVMNTQDEIRRAVAELRNGTFIKHG